MPSWPGEWVQVLLHAIVQVWQPFHLLVLSTAENYRFGRFSLYGNSIVRPSCQL